MALSEQEEFELLSLEREKSQSNQPPATVKGVAQEGFKGLLRGASDVGQTVMSGVTGLMGPVVGPMAKQGLEAVAAPSRQLVQPKPENATEQFAGTAGEIVGSAAAGGGAGSLRSLVAAGLSAAGGATGEQLGGEVGKAIGTVTPFALGALRTPARSLMQSAIKPTIKDLKTGDAARAIDTLLEEGISPTAGGVQKLKDRIAVLNDQIKEAIKTSPATIDKMAVGKNLQQTFDDFASQVNPQSDLAAIKDAWQKFLSHPALQGAERIPVQMAQDLKQGTYSVLNKKYGQVGSADEEAQKALARGLKEEIAGAVPAVAGLNARESRLINAMKVAERRALMEINKNPMGLSLLANNPAAWAAFMADRSAAFKAMVARILYRGAPLNPPGASAAMAAQQLQETQQ